MDILLNIADEYALDRVWASLLPVSAFTTASSNAAGLYNVSSHVSPPSSQPSLSCSSVTAAIYISPRPAGQQTVAARDCRDIHPTLQARSPRDAASHSEAAHVYRSRNPLPWCFALAPLGIGARSHRSRVVARRRNFGKPLAPNTAGETCFSWFRGTCLGSFQGRCSPLRGTSISHGLSRNV